MSRPTVFSLTGKRVLLTGASGFLGSTMARALLEHGASVVLMGRSGQIREVSEELAGEFGADAVKSYQLDMYDDNALTAAGISICSEFQIDVLVNNAFDLTEKTGFNTPNGHFEKSTKAQWESCFQSGVWWAVRLSQIVGEQMKERNGGSVVNISTMYASVAPDPELYEGTSFLNPPGYSAAKAGLVALTRYFASFYGKYQVRANAILPGPFSNVGGDSHNSVPEENPFLDRLRNRTSLKRLGRAEELTGPLVFLASDASSYVTGTTLVVDGGWTVT
jgi:NAD(P)-dependent dehydrogenase (short-subunit alcohol dehydrogenase family)